MSEKDKMHTFTESQLAELINGIVKIVFEQLDRKGLLKSPEPETGPDEQEKKDEPQR